MFGQLYIISGASGSGKTTLLNQLVDKGLVTKAPKYSERPTRMLEDGKTKDPYDDIIHVPDLLKTECDVRYIINGRYYGINTKEITKLLEASVDCAVILSDLRVVNELKKHIGNKAVSIYISSNISPERLNEIHTKRHPFIPSHEQELKLNSQFSRLSSAVRLKSWNGVTNCMRELLDDWQDYLPESKSVKIRAEKIRLFHNRYIDNIALFDFVILNYYEAEQMMKQFINIQTSRSKKILEQKEFSFPPIFLISAASGAGKGTLMEHINLLGSEKLEIITKFALRERKPTDKKDGMKALGEEGTMPNQVDWKWIFHNSNKFKGVEYGVSTADIKANVKAGKAQILVSNIGQIEKAYELFGAHLIPIYLHKTSSREEIRAHQYKACRTDQASNEKERHDRIMEAESKIEAIASIHNSYIQNIAKIKHVILNTTYQEDMFDQIFSLLEHYS